MSRCASCSAEIVWCRTKTGRRIPVNVDPVLVGNITVDDYGGLTELIGGSEPPITVHWASTGSLDGRPRYVSHFATCPNADQHRTNR